MKEKNEYIKVRLDIVLYDGTDIITTSGTDESDTWKDDGNYDKNGWN